VISGNGDRERDVGDQLTGLDNLLATILVHIVCLPNVSEEST
jgi:hypothetical protein